MALGGHGGFHAGDSAGFVLRTFQRGNRSGDVCRQGCRHGQAGSLRYGSSGIVGCRLRPANVPAGRSLGRRVPARMPAWASWKLALRERRDRRLPLRPANVPVGEIARATCAGKDAGMGKLEACATGAAGSSAAGFVLRTSSGEIARAACAGKDAGMGKLEACATGAAGSSAAASSCERSSRGNRSGGVCRQGCRHGQAGSLRYGSGGIVGCRLRPANVPAGKSLGRRVPARMPAWASWKLALRERRDRRLRARIYSIKSAGFRQA